MTATEEQRRAMRVLVASMLGSLGVLALIFAVVLFHAASVSHDDTGSGIDTFFGEVATVWGFALLIAAGVILFLDRRMVRRLAAT
jgi:zinc transporter ZupT